MALASISFTEPWADGSVLTEANLDNYSATVKAWSKESAASINACAASLDAHTQTFTAVGSAHSLYNKQATVYTYSAATVALSTATLAALTDIANASFSFTPLATGLYKFFTTFPTVAVGTTDDRLALRENYLLKITPTGGTATYGPAYKVQYDFAASAANQPDIAFQVCSEFITNLSIATPTTVGVQYIITLRDSLGQHYIDSDTSSTGEYLYISAEKI